jgi:hypothetical protein
VFGSALIGACGLVVVEMRVVRLGRCSVLPCGFPSVGRKGLVVSPSPCMPQGCSAWVVLFCFVVRRQIAKSLKKRFLVGFIWVYFFFLGPRNATTPCHLCCVIEMVLVVFSVLSVTEIHLEHAAALLLQGSKLSPFSSIFSALRTDIGR